MAQELGSIDITSIPELAHLVDEVQRTRRARVLRRADEDVAVLSPVASSRGHASARGVLTEDDALFGLIGAGDSGIPGGVSSKKLEALGRLRHT